MFRWQITFFGKNLFQALDKDEYPFSFFFIGVIRISAYFSHPGFKDSLHQITILCLFQFVFRNITFFYQISFILQQRPEYINKQAKNRICWKIESTAHTVLSYYILRYNQLIHQWGWTNQQKNIYSQQDNRGEACFHLDIICFFLSNIVILLNIVCFVIYRRLFVFKITNNQYISDQKYGYGQAKHCPFSRKQIINVLSSHNSLGRYVVNTYHRYKVKD